MSVPFFRAHPGRLHRVYAFLLDAVVDLGVAYVWLIFFLVCLIAALLPLVILTHWLGI